MNLRKKSMQIMEREFQPFIEEAIKQHPRVITVKLIRGNPVTAHDYARRVLIAARKNGIGRFTAQEVRRCRPPIRVHYSSIGLAFSGTRRREIDLAHWDDYKMPFIIDLMPVEDARWVTLAVNPSVDEIFTLAELLARGVLPNPVELRTKFTLLEVERAVDLYGAQIKVFKNGRCVMLWPKRVSEPAAEPVWDKARRKTKGKRLLKPERMLA